MKLFVRYIVVLLLASVVIIFSITDGICGDLRIDRHSWDSASQSFIVHLSASAGKISAPPLNNYRIKAEVKIQRDGGSKSYVAESERALGVMTHRAGNKNAITKIGTLSIPWDRDGGSLTGTARVDVTVILVDQKGTAVDAASYTTVMTIR